MNVRPLMFTVIPPLAIAYLLVRFVPSKWNASTVIGIVLLIFGVAMVTLARLQLGNSFSVRPQAKSLVTTGIYSRVRNPIYVFSAIAIAGGILYAERPMLLLIFVILIPMQVMRARSEEQVLEERFGQEYRAYKKGTWF
jgi:protein-S-isoprenylcysteine O-methyltransferase Ste14